jgi:hypothetical protein
MASNELARHRQAERAVGGEIACRRTGGWPPGRRDAVLDAPTNVEQLQRLLARLQFSK